MKFTPLIAILGLSLSLVSCMSPEMKDRNRAREAQVDAAFYDYGSRMDDNYDSWWNDVMY